MEHNLHKVYDLRSMVWLACLCVQHQYEHPGKTTEQEVEDKLKIRLTNLQAIPARSEAEPETALRIAKGQAGLDPP